MLALWRAARRADQERLYQWNLQTHYTDGGNIIRNNVWLKLPPDGAAAPRFKAILTALHGCGGR